ncbi:MAG TPA: ATP-binding cassette domain-containing protein [Pseudomonadales bacterium]|nr:ATP-binding cassette domain-containing protein [Pseudomonadales bacterium]
MNAHASLVLHDVCKSFATNLAVDHVSATIPEGSIYGFLGPNGAGKTTLIRMIMSILYPDAGTISVLGSSPDRVKDRLGYLPEEKGLYKKMKTAEMVAYFGRLKGMEKKKANARARELLTDFGLGHCIDQRCDTLSKGMGQKVQIVSTLMHEPELVILDEPFSGLDPLNVETVRSVIVEMKRAGKTVLFSTHVMEQAEQICDAILLINHGQKILDGNLAEIKRSAHQTISLEYEGVPVNMAAIPGVIRVNDMGRAAELSIGDQADPHAVMRCLVDRMQVTSISIEEPSLHEIFVRAVAENRE